MNWARSPVPFGSPMFYPLPSVTFCILNFLAQVCLCRNPVRLWELGEVSSFHTWLLKGLCVLSTAVSSRRVHRARTVLVSSFLTITLCRCVFAGSALETCLPTSTLHLIKLGWWWVSSKQCFSFSEYRQPLEMIDAFSLKLRPLCICDGASEFTL